MRQERWRDVVGYEGLYRVSDAGRVFSLGRDKVLKPVKLNTGYLVVCLHKGGRQRNRSIHRLVAEAFLPNPDALPVVMHLDDDKTNNQVANLQWAAYLTNNTHNDLHLAVGRKAGRTRSRPVMGVSVSNPSDRLYFPSTAAAKGYGFSPGNVSNCCNGRNGQKTHRGYRWSWAKEVS